jgi:predicted Zn finger-like uncharacterized protein
VLLFTASALAQKPSTTKVPVPLPAIDTLKVLQAEKEALLKISKEIDARREQLIQREDDLNDTSATWISIGLGFLAILFTVMAIVAGYIIFMQSRDFKKQVKRTFKKFDREQLLRQVEYNEFITNSKAQVGALLAAGEKLKEILSEHDKQNTSKESENLSSALNHLEAYQKALNDSSMRIYQNPHLQYLDFIQNMFTGEIEKSKYDVSCDHCKEKYVISYSDLINSVRGRNNKVKCKNCGKTANAKRQSAPDSKD